MDIEINLKGIDRIEVIAPTRNYARHFDKKMNVVIQLQDDGRTLKVFAKENEL
jgi:hypothetical protein